MYFSAAVGASLDLVTDENGKTNIEMLSKTLDSTLKNTELVFELVKAGGYAAKLPMFTAFGIKTTTIYCDNPDHVIYYGDVENYDAETGLENMNFTDDVEGMFWTFYSILQQGGF